MFSLVRHMKTMHLKISECSLPKRRYDNRTSQLLSNETYSLEEEHNVNVSNTDHATSVDSAIEISHHNSSESIFDDPLSSSENMYEERIDECDGNT